MYIVPTPRTHVGICSDESARCDVLLSMMAARDIAIIYIHYTVLRIIYTYSIVQNTERIR